MKPAGSEKECQSEHSHKVGFEPRVAGTTRSIERQSQSTDTPSENPDRKDMFIEGVAVPRCHYCGKTMLNYTATKGRFKGRVQRHEWVCDCPKYPKNIVMSVG
jgi:hypothetical protein